MFVVVTPLYQRLFFESILFLFFVALILYIYHYEFGIRNYLYYANLSQIPICRVGFHIRPTSVCEMPRIITKTDLFSKDKSHENRSFCLYYKISRRETENCPNEKSPKNQGLQRADIESAPTIFITN